VQVFGLEHGRRRPVHRAPTDRSNRTGSQYTELLGFGGWATGADVAATNGTYHMIYGRKAFFGYQVLDDGRTVGSPTCHTRTR
jgi:hypothetical protein